MVDGAAARPRSAIDRSLRIIGAFSGAPAAGLTAAAIADRTALPTSTVYRICGRLEEERLLERTPGGRYRVGLRLWELGLLAPRASGLRETALPYLEDLYEVVHENVQLLVLDGTEVVVVERLSAHDAVRLAGRPGGRLPVHATSGGLLLLAHADEQVLDAVAEAPMERFTPATIVTSKRLRAEVALARPQGWVVLREHLTAGSVSVAAPVFDRRRSAVAAVSVVSDLSSGDRVLGAVLTTARAVSRALTLAVPVRAAD